MYDYGRRHADGRTFDVLVLRSEDLLDDPSATLLKLADFVGLSKSPKELCCLSRRKVKDFGSSHGLSTLDEPHIFGAADFEAVKSRFRRFASQPNGAGIGSWETIREKMVEQHRNDHFQRRLLDGMLGLGAIHEKGNGSTISGESPRRLASLGFKVRSDHILRNSKEGDLSQLSHFYNRQNRKPKEVRERLWEIGREILDGNPVLSERLHEEGKDALRSFGYEPRQVFMDPKDRAAGCDDTIVCPSSMV